MDKKYIRLDSVLVFSRIWTAKWYGSNRNFASTLLEDIKCARLSEEEASPRVVSKVLIERSGQTGITIFSGRGCVSARRRRHRSAGAVNLARLMSGAPFTVNMKKCASRKPMRRSSLMALRSSSKSV